MTRSVELLARLATLPGRMPSPLPTVVAVAPGQSREDVLVATWLPVVLGWCRRLGGPRIDVEDAAHDVLITLLARVDDLRDPSALRAFVFGITRRTLAARRRQAWFARWVGSPDIDPRSDRLGPDGELEAQQLAAAVSAALERISADHRELIVLIDLEERSLAEAVELTGLPLGTVKSRLSRARVAFAAAAHREGLQVEEPQ